MRAFAQKTRCSTRSVPPTNSVRPHRFAISPAVIAREIFKVHLSGHPDTAHLVYSVTPTAPTPTPVPDQATAATATGQTNKPAQLAPGTQPQPSGPLITEVLEVLSLLLDLARELCNWRIWPIWFGCSLAGLLLDHCSRAAGIRGEN